MITDEHILTVPVTREQVLVALQLSEQEGHIDHDKFARTFIAKCDFIKGWGKAYGAFSAQGELQGAALFTVSKQGVMNFQLLHVFYKYRRQGLGRHLFLEAFYCAAEKTVPYFRLCSETEAVPFYRSLGLKFWGEQKSGLLMHMCKVKGEKIENAIYDEFDPVIQKALNPAKRGGVVKKFKEPL